MASSPVQSRSKSFGSVDRILSAVMLLPTSELTPCDLIDKLSGRPFSV